MVKHIIIITISEQIPFSKEVKDSGVPKDYVINKWLTDLTPDNKKIYDFYISHDEPLPTIIDLYNNTVFMNTE